MIAMADFRTVDKPKRLAVPPGCACRGCLRKFGLNLIIDLLFDIAGRVIRRKHGLVAMDLFGASGTGWQIRKFGSWCRRSRWRNRGGRGFLIATAKHERGNANDP